MITTKEQHASGCLFGLAFGDALGAATEFLSVADIIHKFPPHGPRDLYGDPARVTDDTQMTIAVGRALLAAPRPYTINTLEPHLRQTFIDWNKSPENNRAPGMTCMYACEALEVDQPWYQATIVRSKGCGANMRVAPVGLLPGIDAKTRASIAQFQAAMTHGHPTALAASDLTATAIADLRTGGDTGNLVARLRDYALSQRQVYHEDWLGPLWKQVGAASPIEFIQRGWDECLSVLDRLNLAIQKADRESDPCETTGDGWIAEEALATGLLCFLLFPDEPTTAIWRGAVTRGDSDSIACLAGAFAGAALGLKAWPQNWLARIEYLDVLAELGAAWDG